ncbi:E3 ubiquitin-protein ligase rbbp6 [Nowakowskiella sp. JEL0078]|nr:E3 ubiquitin-protein ligase rbbp6 [Nowakowskiella sp. JEL0078]
MSTSINRVGPGVGIPGLNYTSISSSGISSRPRVTSLNNLIPNPTGSQTKLEFTANLENMTEEERILAMFQQEEDHWNQEQEKMKERAQYPMYNPRGRGRGRGGPPRETFTSTQQSQHSSEDYMYGDETVKIPPPNYVCYRCGLKGHYISNCPTIGDTDYQPKRLKRTTGIPKIFLKTVENSEGGSGVMVTASGDLVVAQPNKQAWHKISEQSKNFIGNGDIYDLITEFPKEFECSLGKHLMRDAIQTPCCKGSFCDECIRSQFVEPSDPSFPFSCSLCRRTITADSLIPNQQLREAVERFLRDFNKDKINNSQKPARKKYTIISKDGTIGPLIRPNSDEPVIQLKPGQQLAPGQMVEVRPGFVMRIPHVVDDDGEEITPQVDTYPGRKFYN